MPELSTEEDRAFWILLSDHAWTQSVRERVHKNARARTASAIAERIESEKDLNIRRQLNQSLDGLRKGTLDVMNPIQVDQQLGGAAALCARAIMVGRNGALLETFLDTPDKKD